MKRTILTILFGSILSSCGGLMGDPVSDFDPSQPSPLESYCQPKKDAQEASNCEANADSDNCPKKMSDSDCIKTLMNVHTEMGHLSLSEMTKRGMRQLVANKNEGGITSYCEHLYRRMREDDFQESEVPFVLTSSLRISDLSHWTAVCSAQVWQQNLAAVPEQAKLYFGMQGLVEQHQEYENYRQATSPMCQDLNQPTKDQAKN